MFSPDIETLDRTRLRELQLVNLQKTVRRVYENVPLYRQRFDEACIKPSDIKTLDDLTRLPFTYKQDLRDTYPYGLFAAPMEEVVRIHASSGTTGKQTVVGYTRNDLDMWSTCAARALSAAGATLRDKVHV